ncbi:MAG TPA: histidine kinase [Gemmatimonadaceae bacterium]|nr:histidine kinase [Gemmatimonadaceae bacterium]
MSRARFTLLYILAWVPLALLYAVVLASQRGIAVSDGLWGAGFSVGTAALLGAVAWWLSARIRYERTHRARFLVTHAILALVYGGLLTTAIATSIRINAPADTYDRFMRDAFGWQLIYGVALYGVVVGISYAVQAAGRLREEERRAARAEALRVDAELRALRAQLNPHFLFNTLHSITALVRADPDGGERALEEFAALLRYVLDVNRERNEEVTLEVELGFVRTYLSLERLRLGDRLRVVEEIDPDALECLVLAFSLQPLVENAIRHGIAPRAGPGTLRLAATVADDELVLEVADDGPGSDDARVTEAQGLGLAAVRQRLETRWGSDARMEIVTAPHNGFLVRLRMPSIVTPMLRARTGELRRPDDVVAQRAESR